MKAKHVSWLVIVMLLVTSCTMLPSEERRQAQVYYSNYLNVLAWVKEGMDESVIKDKLGVQWTQDALRSTYSSMGYTVHEYKFYEVYSLDEEHNQLVVYPRVTVWLTFINGTLDSISTFR